MSLDPLPVPSNAIDFPSGDQRGLPTDGPRKEVNCVCLEPSASADQSSLDPVRLLTKAMRAPSGETLRSRLSPIDSTIGSAVVPPCPPSATLKILVSNWPLT